MRKPTRYVPHELAQNPLLKPISLISSKSSSLALLNPLFCDSTAPLILEKLRSQFELLII
jgi:hypothetical protein